MLLYTAWANQEPKRAHQSPLLSVLLRKANISGLLFFTPGGLDCIGIYVISCCRCSVPVFYFMFVVAICSLETI